MHSVFVLLLRIRLLLRQRKKARLLREAISEMCVNERRRKSVKRANGLHAEWPLGFGE